MDKILKAIFFCLLFLAGSTVADIIFPAFIPAAGTAADQCLMKTSAATGSL